MITGDGIDLLLKIKGDSSDAVKASEAVKDAVQKDVAAIEKSNQSLEDSFSSVQSVFSDVAKGATAVVTAVAATAVGMFALAKNAADAASEISRFSSLTGLGVESVNSLKVAAEQTGRSLESVSELWESFSEQLAEAAAGEAEAVKNLAAAGIKAKDVYTDLEGTVAKAIKYVADGTSGVEQNTRAMKLWGQSGLDIINISKQMGGDMEAYTKKLKEMGLVMDEDGIHKSREFNKALGELTLQATAVANNFALGFMPKITSAMEEISGSLRGNKSVWREWGEEIGDIILRLTRGVGVVKGVFKDLVDISSGLLKFNPTKMGFFPADGFSGMNTMMAFQQNAEAYDNDARKKATADFMNDPNRPDWLKQQDKDIASSAKRGDGKITKGDSKDGKSAGKSAGESFDKQFRAWADEIDFSVSRTFGGAVNKNSKHPGGLAGDLKVGGKSRQEIIDALADGIKKGWRALDESLGAGSLPGVTTKGKNIHFEGGNSKKPSMFIENRPDLYGGAAGLAYLKKLDADRLAGKTSVDEIAEFNKKQVEDQKKKNEEIVKLNDEATKRVLVRAQQSANEQNAINEQLLAKKQISQDEFDRRSDENAIELLNKEKILLEDRLAFARQYGTSTIEIEQEIDAVTSQIRVKQTEAETAAYLRSKKYQEDLKALRLEVLQSEREVIDFRKEQQRKILENDVEFSRGRARLDALVVLREFEIQENDRRRKQALEDAEIDRKRSLEGIEDREKEREKVEEINKLYENRRDIINGIHEAQNRQTEEDYANEVYRSGSDKFGGGMFGDLMGQLSVITDPTVDAAERQKIAIESVAGAYDMLGKTAGAAINSMIGLSQSLVQQWILTGKMSGKAILELAASVVSSLVVQAGVLAIFEVAKGYAALATAWFNPAAAAEAAMHFTSAKTFGIIAGVAAVAAVGLRAGIGDSYSGNQQANQANTTTGGRSGGGSGSGSQGGYYSSHGSEVNIREEDRFRPREVNHIIKLQVQSNDSHITRVVESDINNRGNLHGLIIKYVEG